jgi:hypothetical protein
VAERPTHQPRFPLTADMSELLAAARQYRAEAGGRSLVGIRELLMQAWLRHIERALRRLEGDGQEMRGSVPHPAPRVGSPNIGRLRLLEFR